MIKYIPVADVQMADFLSRALWRLSKPTSQPQDISTYYAEWMEDPAPPIAYLSINDTDMFLIAETANRANLVLFVQGRVAAGKFTQAMADWVLSQFDTLKGQRVTPSQMIPSEIYSQSKTYDELVASGIIQTGP